MGYFSRFVALIVLLAVCSDIQSSDGARCPPPAWIKPTRTCISDKECYPGLCCLDYQGRKSCALPQTVLGRGTAMKADVSRPRMYCDGVECRPDQVCKPDSITKRLRCQRA